MTNTRHPERGDYPIMENLDKTVSCVSCHQKTSIDDVYIDKEGWFLCPECIKDDIYVVFKQGQIPVQKYADKQKALGFWEE